MQRLFFLFVILLIGCNTEDVPKSVNISEDVRPITELAQRIIGENAQSFTFDLVAKDSVDFFEFQSVDDKIHIIGTDGIALASGLNWYLENYCDAQVGLFYRQVNLPNPLPSVPDRVYMETRFQDRLMLDPDAFATTLLWYNFEDWEQLIDWMALHGVNMPLALVGHEAVWYETLIKQGFEEKEILNFLSGPAYLPWQFQGKVNSVGGPLTTATIKAQKALQLQILERMKALDMTPVLGGYIGMLPANASVVFPNASLLENNSSPEIPTSYFLAPTDSLYQQIARSFYQTHQELYGEQAYFYLDPSVGHPSFQENPNETSYVEAFLKPIKSVHAKAAWIYPNGTTQADIQGFGAPNEAHFVTLQIPFSGNTSMGGNLPKLVENANVHQGKGVAFPWEGFGYNPLLEEFTTYLIWQPEGINLEQWTSHFARRRYGASNFMAEKAWVGFLNTVYNHTPAQPFFFQTPTFPDPNLFKENVYGLDYDLPAFVEATKALFLAKSGLSENEAFQFDAIHATRELMLATAPALANRVRVYHERKSAILVQQSSDNVMVVLKQADDVLIRNKHFLMGNWIEKAKEKVNVVDELDEYLWNAKSILTLWHPSLTLNARDYHHKEWNGLMTEYYQPRWEIFFKEVHNATKENRPIDYDAIQKERLTFEGTWLTTDQNYKILPVGDAVINAEIVLDYYDDVINKSLPREF